MKEKKGRRKQRLKMSTETNNSNSGTGNKSRSKTKRQYFLTAETILKYLLEANERISTMILCKEPDTDLVTTDYELYQAFGSIKKYDGLAHAMLVKLFENVDIISHRKENNEEKKILTHERVEELRKIALEDDKND
jgi:hypothetical protein